MANTSLDIRQSQTRTLQDQLNLNATQQMDSTLASINNELTPPGRLIAAATPSLVITVGSGTIVNPNTSKNRVLPFINNVPVSFTGGTITFPSTSGTITVSAGTNGSITIGASQYCAVLIQINSSGQFSLITGTPASSLGAAVVPSGSTSLLSLGYVIVQSNASSIIQSITDAMLYQFVGGGGSGSGTVTSFAFTNQDNVTGTVTNSTTTPTLALAPTSSTPAASSFASWDANKNLSANNLLEGYTTTATAAGTTVLTVGSSYQQFFTGTTTQTVVLPVTSTLVLGQQFLITNASSGIVTVQSSGANTVIAQPGSSSYLYTCVLTSGTTAASWYAVPYSGGGAVTPTVTVLTSGSGTFTTPANALYLTVQMVGGGGGGGSSESSGAANAGGTGITSVFGVSSATGGSGGGGSAGGGGGNGALGSGPTGFTLAGQAGGPTPTSVTTLSVPGGAGGSTVFGGGGQGILGNNSGNVGVANTGGGGSGAGGISGALFSGAGGGAGGYVFAVIVNPAPTYSYTVGAGGAGGTAGTGGSPGSAGGSGVIIITEFYANGAIGTATNVTGIVQPANGGTGSNTLAGNYYASMYYPVSSSNYWSTTSSSFANFTVSGTIPTPSTYVNSNLGTISKATSSYPGINFSAPRTGTLKVTALMSLQASGVNIVAGVQLQETTTSTVMGSSMSEISASTGFTTTVTGFIPTTSGTTYNINLEGLTSTGTLSIITGATAGAMLTFAMEYIS